MRVGLIAPPWLSVPPVGYGGTEVVLDNLARGLQQLGHEVRLFTVGDSRCPVPRGWLFPSPPAIMGAAADEAAHDLAAYEAMDDVDVVHDHSLLGPLLVAGRRRAPGVPIVSTHHGAFTPENVRIFRSIAEHARVVAISHDQAGRADGVPITAVIHHGIDLDAYRPGSGNGEFLLFIGRMSPDKGVHHAVRVAHATGLPLRIASKIREACEWEYFEHAVHPLLAPQDELLVEPPFATRLELLQDAVALVNPIAWDEPFGLVMAEALATATPVLAFPRGAAPEIVDDGTTGFLCTDTDAMIAAVARIGSIDRAACRDAAERRFSLQRMARDHESLYRRVLDEDCAQHPPAGGRAHHPSVDHGPPRRLRGPARHRR